MEAPTSKSANPILLTAAVALILFCAAGIGAINGWIPTSAAGGAPVQIAAAPANGAAQAGPGEKHRDATSGTKPATTLPTAKASCAECGVVESVQAVETKGNGSGLGGVGGAVVGGMLGNQVGAGRGRDVMTVVGAVGGALAGNEIEKRVKSTKSYQITVRLDDGSTRIFHEGNPPAWRAGDKVRIVDGQIRADSA